MRTFVPIFALVTLSAGFLAACGNDDSDSARGSGGGSSKGGSAGDASAGKGGTGSASGSGGGGTGGSAGSGVDGGPSSPCDELGPRASFAPEHDVLVKTTDDAVEVVAAAADGARIAFEAGVHRVTQPIVAKSGQALLGLPGAILSGAVALTGWTASGSVWTVGGQTQEKKLDPEPHCKVDRPLCYLDNDVFYDHTRLEPVASAGEVGPGKYFFDDANDTISIGDDPNGHRVEMSIAEVAINGGGGGVRLENLVFERFAPPVQKAAVRAGDTWVIEHVEVRENHGIGLSCGNQVTLRSSYIHHNGQLGISGAGEDIVIEDNHLGFNNTAGYDSFWEAGGNKFVYTTNMLVKNNCSHDNDGPGFWTDINNRDTRYEGNIAKDNTRPGIFHEISYAAVITGNTCLRNGVNSPVWLVENAGILVTMSPNVEIFDNVLEDNGIWGVQDPRVGGDFGPWETSNLNVHDNQIGMAANSGSGLALAAVTDTIWFTSKNNRFENNTYQVPQAGQKQWYWADGPVDFPTWQSYGHDDTGSVQSP